MGHGLTKTDKMAFVGELPWHGMGHEFERHVTGRKMHDECFNWTVSANKLAAIYGHGLNLEPRLLEIPDRIAIVRDDTLEVFTTAVSDKYTILQNVEATEFAEALVEHGAIFETGGSLFGGRRCWLLARIELSGIEVLRADGTTDESMAYLLVSWRHDGFGSLVALATRVRVVCNNTYQMAVAGATNSFRITHRANIHSRMEEARETLRMQTEYQRILSQRMVELDRERIDREAVRDWAASTLSDVEGTLDTIVADMGDRKAERLVEDAETVTRLFRDGVGNHGESKYDALQGLTEFLDHHKLRMRRGLDRMARLERRLDDTLFGESVRIKQRGYNLLTK